MIPIALVSTCAITLFLVTLCFQLSNHFDVQVRACRFFLDHNDKKSALTLARSCVEQQPLNPLGWQLQSFCRSDDDELAASDLDRAIELSPTAEARLSRSWYYFKSGDMASAEALLKSVIADDKADTHQKGFAINGLAWQAALKSQAETALDMANDAVSLLPTYSYAYGTRGYTRAVNGDLKSALADFSTAISLDERNAAVLFMRADVFRSLGKVELADSDVKRALNIAPSRSKAFDGAKLMPVTSFVMKKSRVTE